MPASSNIAPTTHPDLEPWTGLEVCSTGYGFIVGFFVGAGVVIAGASRAKGAVQDLVSPWTSSCRASVEIARSWNTSRLRTPRRRVGPARSRCARPRIFAGSPAARQYVLGNRWVLFRVCLAIHFRVCLIGDRGRRRRARHRPDPTRMHRGHRRCSAGHDKGRCRHRLGGAAAVCDSMRAMTIAVVATWTAGAYLP